MEWSFRLMRDGDLADLMVLQEEGAVAGLSNVFPQHAHPFPRDTVLQRWQTELDDPAIAPYVATSADGRPVGFAARRGDELLHFGTAPDTWGGGLAAWLHDRLITTYPPDVLRIRLRVFDANHRARRFYEKLGWKPTGVESRSSFPPHPTLLEYVLDRAEPPAAG